MASLVRRHVTRMTGWLWLREAFVDVFDTVIYTMRLPRKEPEAA